MLWFATVVHGQARSDSQTNPSSDSSQVISAAFPPPLTPPQDARYQIVHYCKVQATRIADSVQWDHRADTIPWRSTDTLPTAVRNRAQKCIDRFDIAQVGRLFFQTAAEVALIAGNDSTLIPIIDSVFIVQRQEREAGNIWTGPVFRLFDGLLSAAPARVDLAKRILAVDAVLNDGASLPPGELRNLIQNDRIGLFSALYRFGNRTGDVQAMEEWRDSLQATFTMLQKQDSTDLYRQVSNEMLMHRMNREIYGIRFGSDSILAVGARHKKLFGLIFPDNPEQAAREIGGFVLFGKPAPPANPPFTFFRNGITKLPEPGRTMVVLRVGESCDMECGAEIMRFKSKIGDVPLVMLAQVYGNVRQSNPGTPAENAEALRAHLQDSLGVNLSLMVDTAPRYVIAAPDSRHLYGNSRLRLDWADAGKSTTFVADPPRIAVAGIVVINKDGLVVWEMNFFSGKIDNKEFIAKVINKLASE